MVPPKQGSRGIRGVKEEGWCCMAPLPGILTKKMVVPPPMVSGGTRCNPPAGYIQPHHSL